MTKTLLLSHKHTAHHLPPPTAYPSFHYSSISYLDMLAPPLISILFVFFCLPHCIEGIHFQPNSCRKQINHFFLLLLITLEKAEVSRVQMQLRAVTLSRMRWARRGGSASHTNCSTTLSTVTPASGQKTNHTRHQFTDKRREDFCLLLQQQNC